MHKQEIIASLKIHHQNYLAWFSPITIDKYTNSNNEKWTPGQHLQHIIQSVKPLQFACSLPLFVLSYKFGKANRPSKTYDALVEKYKAKLLAGGRASANFIPESQAYTNKLALEQQLQKIVSKLCKRIEKYSEQQLDTYILPHPLLGKLTLREMFYFTIYHVQHHQALLNRDYGE